ncbi:DNA gyrase inhibitor YacG [Cohaesibacter celericrescens]|uniref:DNA gyrase inhibitor YacG n=1 Tax=Cohaesibacter celericrescens TaxID=2067669 RepID=UPI0035650252
MTDKDKSIQTAPEAQTGADAETGVGKVAGLRRARPCPICSKPSVKANYPFCSPRCKDVDLSRWFKGSYAIAAVEQDDPDDDDFGQFS